MIAHVVSESAVDSETGGAAVAIVSEEIADPGVETVSRRVVEALGRGRRAVDGWRCGWSRGWTATRGAGQHCHEDDPAQHNTNNCQHIGGSAQDASSLDVTALLLTTPYNYSQQLASPLDLNRFAIIVSLYHWLQL